MHKIGKTKPDTSIRYLIGYWLNKYTYKSLFSLKEKNNIFLVSIPDSILNKNFINDENIKAVNK